MQILVAMLGQHLLTAALASLWTVPALAAAVGGQSLSIIDAGKRDALQDLVSPLYESSRAFHPLSRDPT